MSPGHAARTTSPYRTPAARGRKNSGFRTEEGRGPPAAAAGAGLPGARCRRRPVLPPRRGRAAGRARAHRVAAGCPPHRPDSGRDPTPRHGPGRNGHCRCPCCRPLRTQWDRSHAGPPPAAAGSSRKEKSAVQSLRSFDDGRGNPSTEVYRGSPATARRRNLCSG